MYDILAGAVIIKLFADSSLFSFAMGVIFGIVLVSKYPPVALVVQTGLTKSVDTLRVTLERIQAASRPGAQQPAVAA